MKISVIIPSYNRKDILLKCLNVLFEQTYSKEDFEIIVIDDGSTDGTEFIVKETMEKSQVALRYFRQENKGPAAARNLGIKNAFGDIVLFLGDDIIAIPTLIEEHNKWHILYPYDNVVVLGYVTWSKDIQITPFMRWLENGVQFNYKSIKSDVELEFDYFVSSNVSLKKDFLVKTGGFDEDFRYAVYEDIELGYRLKKQGMKLQFNPNAIGYHLHPVNIIFYSKRQYLAGKSAVLLFNKHPGLKKVVKPSNPLSAAPFIVVKFLLALVVFPVAYITRNGFLLNKTFGAVATFFKWLGCL